MEIRQLLAVNPVILQLDGTPLTNNQTLPWQAGIALNVRAVDNVDTNNNPSGGTTFTGNSTPNNTEFAWNFGDSGAATDPDYTTGVRSAHNIEEGFLAAHIYDTAGTYPLTLTTTDVLGNKSTVTVNVQVNTSQIGSSKSDVENVIGGNILYVDSVSGSDNYTGTAPSFTSGTQGPLKSFAGVLKILQTNSVWQNNVQVRFKRGQTFPVHQADYANGTTLSVTNIIFGAYGATTLAKPILSVADTGLQAIFFPGAYGTANGWTIQDITFNSSVAVNSTYTAYGDAVRLRGTDIAVRNVSFGHFVNDIYAWGEVHGILIQDCTDGGNWVSNYALACIQVYSDWVVVGNSFTGASERSDGNGGVLGNQPFIRWESVNTADNGRILFADNTIEPTMANNAAVTFREDSGTISNIGSSSVGSTNSTAAGVYTLTAAGTGFQTGTSDQFGYLSDSYTGDGAMIATVASLSSPASSEAGVMFRYDSSNSNAIYAAVVVTPNSKTLFQYRTSAGGAPTTVTVSTTAKWVKAVRTGNSFAGYYSSDGKSWTLIGSAVTINMNTTATAGLAISSGISGTACTATITNMTLDGFVFGGHANNYIYAVHNTIGNMGINFGFQGGNTPGYLERWIVADSNTLINSTLQVSNSGIHVMIRNNLIEKFADDTTDPDTINEGSGGSTVGATGYGEEDIQVLNNTGYTERTGDWAGRFNKYMGSAWHNAIIANNLLVAKNATPGSYAQAFWAPSLSEFAQVSDNIWTDPKGDGSGLVIAANGTNITVANWNTNYRRNINSGQSASSFDDVAAAIALDSNFAPIGTNANIGAPIAGVWADMNGKLRTAGTWTVGAIDIISPATAPNYGLFTNDLDIGSATPAGSVSYASGTYTNRGGGADIWGTSDQFNYLYLSSAGDETMVAAVTGLTNTHTKAKAAVMMRNSPAANAAFVMLDVKPDGSMEFVSRATDGGSAAYNAGTGALGAPSASNPIWEKLVRSGNSFSAYYATGTAYPSSWTLISTITINGISSNSYLSGLVVCSHVSGTGGTGVFTNVSVTPVVPAAPGTLSATATSGTQITLTWADNSTNETGFKIDRATSSDFTQNLTTISVAANNTSTASYLDSPPTGSGIYCYRVRATNSGGDSANTAVTAAGLWAAPATPTTYLLRLDPANPANAQVRVNALSPVSVPLSLLSSLYLAGSSGDDTLTVDSTQGNPLPAGGVIFNGASHAAAGDTLVLHGSGNASAVTLTATQLTLDGRLLTYSNVQSLTADSDLGGDTWPLVSVTGVTLNLTASQHLTGLTLADNARVQLTAGGSKFLELGSLTIAATATLDLNDHDLLVHNASEGPFTNWIHTSRLCSTTAGGTTGLKGLALIGGEFYHALNGSGTKFQGQDVSDNDVLVKYTYHGDANLDGAITMDDYLQIDSGFLFGGVGYAWGDFDYSGQINVTDYALIDTSFANQGDSQATQMANLHATWFLSSYAQAVENVISPPVPPSPPPAVQPESTTSEIPPVTSTVSADDTDAVATKEPAGVATSSDTLLSDPTPVASLNPTAPVQPSKPEPLTSTEIPLAPSVTPPIEEPVWASHVPISLIHNAPNTVASLPSPPADLNSFRTAPTQRTAETVHIPVLSVSRVSSVMALTQEITRSDPVDQVRPATTPVVQHRTPVRYMARQSLSSSVVLFPAWAEFVKQPE